MYRIDREETRMPSPNAELLPGTLQLLILRTLVSGAVHGYAIAKKIKETSSGLLQVEEGSLYPALNRMLVKGWVTAEWGLSETNRKARYYTLTREGRKQLAREAGDFRKLVDAIELVLQHA
jgi:PadR family transcriptional regulator, regulatory protein PadR